MAASSDIDRPRRGWQEHAGDGVRRDHRVSCVRSRDRRAGGRCSCPWSWWRPSVPGRARERSAPFFGTLGEARDAKRRQQVHAIDARSLWREQRAQLPAEGELTVFDYFTRWLQQNEKRLAPGTVEQRANSYRSHLHPVFGAVRVMDVTAQQVENWVHDTLGSGAKYWPMRSAFNTLQAMLGEAARKRHIDWNPCMAVDLPEMPQRVRRDHLTMDEYRAVVAACETPQERLWVRLAGEAGLRRGEVAGLKASAVDLDAEDGPELLVAVNIVHVKGAGLIERPPKGGKTRIVSLTPTLVQLLREHIDTNDLTGDDYLFTSPGGEGTVKPDTLGVWVTRVIARAGLVNDKLKPVFHMHDLRRTAATLARERGVSVEVIRDQLGHGHERMTTRHYIRARTNPNLGDFAAVMDGITDIEPDQLAG